MTDLYEQLLDSIDTLTPEQLAELASIMLDIVRSNVYNRYSTQ